MNEFMRSLDRPLSRPNRAVGMALPALALVLLLTACGPKTPERAASATAATNIVRPVQMALATRASLARGVRAIGELAAREESTLSVKVSGRLQDIAVDVGSAVRTGDVLARVEPQDYELQLRQAEALLAQVRARLGLPVDVDSDRFDPREASTVKLAAARLEEAQRNRDRATRLAGQGISSQSEQDSADAAYEVAANVLRDAIEEVNNRLAQLTQRRVEVEIARKRLSDSSIRAPFDGLVQRRTASPGEYVAAGTPVVTLVAVNPLRLRLEVPEREAAAVRSGQRVLVSIEGETNTPVGVISRVSPAIDRESRMLMVEADVPNDGTLRPGSFAQAEIIVLEQDEALLVPAAAVATFAGVEKVFTVQDGRAREHTVTTGRRLTNLVEIVHGLAGGETVVLEPGPLQNGQAISPAPVAAHAVPGPKEGT